MTPRPSVPNLRRTAAALLALGISLVPGVASLADSPSPAQRLRALEREIRDVRARDLRLAREGEAIRRELGDLRGRSIAAAALLQDLESRAASHATQLAELTRQTALHRQVLAARADNAGRAVAALTRLARLPPELIAFATDSPVDTLRGARLAGAAIPGLAAELRHLADALAEADRLTAAITAEQARLAAAESERSAERTRLNELIRRRLELDVVNAEARSQAASDIAERVRAAAELRDALARPNVAAGPLAAAQRRAAEVAGREARAVAERAQPARNETVPPAEAASDSERFAAARGRILPPVRGRIVGAFGQPDADGHPHRGLAFETAAAAQVVAPFAGQIVFAGPFRSYGLVLIIDHGEGYHSVLLGLARIDGTLGQGVIAGEPVGLADATDGGRPGIYLELRRAGLPIDPSGWLAASNRGESG